MRITSTIALLVLANMFLNFALAQQVIIYKTVHEDGTVTYSDQPSPGAVEVSLHVNTNTMQSTPVPKQAAQAQITQKKRDYQVSIISPEHDATVRSNNGQLTIKAALEPSLSGIFQLTINEQIVESINGLFVLENMDRGSYQYQVNFISNSGKVIASSETRSLHLHRTSVLLN